jgi:trehalose 6-phosphate synthase
VGYRDAIVKLGAFPISIDFAALDELSRTPKVIARAAEIRSELGDPTGLISGGRPPRPTP